MSTATKVCKFCRSAIDAQAMKCPQCQEWLRAKPVAPWNPVVAMLFSFFIPGAGFWYRGKIAEGFIWLCLAVLGYSLSTINPTMILAGFLIHMLCVVRSAMK